MACKNIILDHEEMSGPWGNESIPETDSTPHINVGQQFQCKVPPFISSSNKYSTDPCYEDLLWDPGISGCSDAEGNYPCSS